MSTIYNNPLIFQNIQEIERFIVNEPGEKIILKKEGKQLKFVEIEKTSLFERIQAWFGFGPLSLKTIANFIIKNHQAIDAQIKLYEKTNKDWFEKEKEKEWFENPKKEGLEKSGEDVWFDNRFEKTEQKVAQFYSKISHSIENYNKHHFRKINEQEFEVGTKDTLEI